MYRHEAARSDQREHSFQVLFAGVAGYVDRTHAVVDDFGAAAGDVILDSSDCALVPRDGAGGEHDYVPRIERDVRVRVGRDAGKRGERLSLRSRDDA